MQLPNIVRVTHPTRPDKAHHLGYNEKKGYVFNRLHCALRAQESREGRDLPQKALIAQESRRKFVRRPQGGP